MLQKTVDELTILSLEGFELSPIVVREKYRPTSELRLKYGDA